VAAIAVTTGGVSSVTVMRTVSVALAPWESVTVNVTVWVPTESGTVGRGPIALTRSPDQTKERVWSVKNDLLVK
jgi:hypothetical protein